MDIEYIKGNLFETEHKVIVHGCNAMGRMGSGVARIVNNDFNEAYQAYRSEFETTGLELGTVVWAESNGYMFANAITQDRFGHDGKNYVNYDAIRACMEEVHGYCVAHGYSHAAMPMIGAGLGGGDWEIISNIIEVAFINVQPVVYVI